MAAKNPPPRQALFSSLRHVRFLPLEHVLEVPVEVGLDMGVIGTGKVISPVI